MRRTALIPAALLTTLAVMASGAASAMASPECKSEDGCTPWWHLTANVWPANIAPNGEGTLVVKAVNTGDATTTGALTLADTLPPGVTVLEEGGAPAVGFFAFADGVGGTDLKAGCKVVGQAVSCALAEGEYPLVPFEDIEMRIRVKAGTATEEEEAEVSGGGAPPARTQRPIPVGAGDPPFAVESLEQAPEEADGSLDARAGSHPFQFSTTLALDQTSDPLVPPALAKDLRFELPAGFVGNATAVPRCSEADFRKIVNYQNYCPPDTAVGVASVTFDEPIHTGLATYPLPLYNLVPAPGEPARFGFTVIKTPVILDTGVRSGEDYGVRVSVADISQAVNFISTTTTFWGVPSDPRHDAARGSACLAGGEYNVLKEPCEESIQPTLTPFLTLPSSCRTPFQTSVQGDSWPLKAGPGSEPEGVVLAGQTSTALKGVRPGTGFDGLQPAVLRTADRSRPRRAGSQQAERPDRARPGPPGSLRKRAGPRQLEREGHHGRAARGDGPEPRGRRRAAGVLEHADRLPGRGRIRSGRRTGRADAAVHPDAARSARTGP